MSKKLATAFVILAGALWGIISIFINKLSDFGFTTPEISFLRVFTCAVLLFFFLLFYNRKLLKINIKDIWMFIGTGIVSLTLFSFCYFATIVKAGASIAVSLLYTSPVFVMIFSALLFKEKITAKNIIAMVMTVTGCALVSGMIGTGDKMGLVALLTGIGAGLFYALYSIFSRFALSKYHPFTITFYTFVFASIGFLFFVNPIEIATDLAEAPSMIWIVIISGLLCGALPYVFYTIGLKYMDTTVAGIMVAVEPLVGNIVGIAILGESADFLKITGVVLILASIILLSVQFKKSKKTKQ